jgi:hypothetical protein
MRKTAEHNKVNYIEFTTTDIEKTKKFYSTVFGWSFKDWGADYIDCGAPVSGIALGFSRGDRLQAVPTFAPLIVLYSSDLEATEEAIIAAGGIIVVSTFTFPGGRRFHFTDNAGNVLGVWSE